MKVEFSRQIFEKLSIFNFHEIPSSGDRVPCGQTDGRTDMTKLLVAFRNFAKAPKNKIHSFISIQPFRPGWEEPEPSHVTGMALAHCILGKFLGVVCHCFPPSVDVPTRLL